MFSNLNTDTAAILRTQKKARGARRKERVKKRLKHYLAAFDTTLSLFAKPETTPKVTQWTPGGDDPAVPFLIHVKTSIDEVTSAKSRRSVVNPESIERALGKACAMLREREDKENRAPVDYSKMNKWQRLVHTWMPCTKWVNEDTGESFDLTRLKDLDDLQMHARNRLNNGYLTLIVARRTLPGLVDEVRATAAGKRSWASYLGPPPLPGSVRANYLPCFDESAIINRGLEWLSLFVIIVSVVGFCVESLPEYRLHDDGTERNTPPNALYALDATCIGLFTFEYLWRLGVAVDKKAFVKEAMNVIDLLAILPFYISLVPGVHGTTARAISVVRVIRLLKVSRHSRGIQNMSMCMWATRSELALFVIMVTVCTILFATALFYTEHKQKDSNFQSIPDAFWWAIISMTTVGYGDVFPVTEWGRLVASLCVSVCVIAVAIPASIFISEFLKLHHLDDTISEIQPGAPSGLHVLRRHLFFTRQEAQKVAELKRETVASEENAHHQFTSRQIVVHTGVFKMATRTVVSTSEPRRRSTVGSVRRAHAASKSKTS